jgi:Rad3-related DNA helicase
MEQIFKDHVKDCTGGEGAILMGVCKARMSEGIDFSDD